MSITNIETWLSSHSDKVERIGGEIVFTHFSKETSVLLPRESWRDDLLFVDAEELGPFYEKYWAASVGNSHLIWATNIMGGISISHGYRIPDLHQMSQKAESMGVMQGDEETVFLAEAGWMFLYTYDVRGVLRKYDRDYPTVTIIDSVASIFDAWWKIVEEDPL